MLASAVKQRSLEEAIKNAKISIVQVGCDENKFDESKQTMINKRKPLLDISNRKRKDVKVIHEEIVQQNKTLENYIGVLEQKLKQATHQNEVEQSKYQTLQRKVTFYETMTGMTVYADALSEVYVCTVKNTLNRAATRFQITLDSSLTASNLDGEAKYVLDLQFRPIANGALLPEYLATKEIECSSHLAPVLLSDIIQQLYPDKEHSFVM